MMQRRAVLKVKRGRQPSEWTLADAVGQVAELAALQETIAAVRSDRKVSVEGVWPGAVAPIVAAWICQDSRPILVIAPQVADAEALAAESES